MNEDLLSTARLALACLDLTSLNESDDAAAVEALCARATTPHGNVAAVCVWPRFVAQARKALPASVAVAAVANFPAGALDIDLALTDSAAIASAGGNEIDLVLPWSAWAAGQVLQCATLVRAVRRAQAGLRLKLILETGELDDEALIAGAARMALSEGVDFLKTSTGKTRVSATPSAARTLLAVIAAHPRRAEAGFKASGGVRTVAEAAVYIDLVRETLGSVGPHNFRIGASSLMGDILTTLDDRAAGKDGPAAAASTY